MDILYETSKLALNSRGTILLIIAMFVAAFMLASFISEMYLSAGISVIVIVFLIGLIAILGTEKHKVIKATLLDEYPVYSLFDEYEVKGREGDIWILEEKK